MRWQADKFRREEDGALLVFFAICASAIFLVAALSFDIGKRASTQTELQSFADNIALAAGGELDGLPGALLRAERAANELITDTYAFGEGDNILSAGDFELSFYANLPLNVSDTGLTTPLTPSASSDRRARFVQVNVNPVEVEWEFANLLSIFSDQELPDASVAAEAMAGYTTAACNVSSLFFCLPPATSADSDGIWDPKNHIGSAIELRTGEGVGANWDPGEFGFITGVGTVPADPCHGLSLTQRLSCLLGAEETLTQCYENGKLSLIQGRRSGVTPSFLNAGIDIFNQGFGLQSDDAFSPGPIVTRPYAAGSQCRGEAPVVTNDTTDFPTDDCLQGGGSCSTRFGDGDWQNGRLDYVETNYSINFDTFGTIAPEELITVGTQEFHIDDPFRPTGSVQRSRPEYTGFPVLDATASRWQYYNAEVAAAYYESPSAAFQDGEVNPLSLERVAPQDLIRDLEQLIPAEDNGSDDDDTNDTDTIVFIPRAGSSLPQCSAPSLDPRRRTFVAAVVDCGAYPSNATPVGRATWFVELFVFDVTSTAISSRLSISAEITSGGLRSDPAPSSGTFRNLVQLYR